MIPFREQNPVKIGAISIMVLAIIMVIAFKASDLPLIGGGQTYYADFSEAGGLKTGSEVRIAGVRAGKVDSIKLDGNKVKVGFKVKTPANLGTKTGADIKVKTLLGDMYLDLRPAGSGTMDSGSTIPESRTVSPYDVVDAFSDLSKTTEQIDTKQLGAALTTLADLTRSTPDSFRAALTGVSALSSNLAAKDTKINTLLQRLDVVTKTLNARDTDIIQLMNDANTLFTALVQRREAVHTLLVSTTTLSKQLSSFIDDSRADLKPALTSLNTVLNVFTKDQESLSQTLNLMAPFYRVFANVLGNGPWFDSYIQNMPPVPAVTK